MHKGYNPNQPRVPAGSSKGGQWAKREAAERIYNNVYESDRKPVGLGMQFFASKEKQFGKKVGRHAKDFGLDPSKTEDRNRFQRIIDTILSTPDEIRIGEWRSQPKDVLFFIKKDDVVVTQQDKTFITILKGGITNARVKRARKR